MSTSRTPAAVFGEYALPFHMLCRTRITEPLNVLHLEREGFLNPKTSPRKQGIEDLILSLGLRDDRADLLGRERRSPLVLCLQESLQTGFFLRILPPRKPRGQLRWCRRPAISWAPASICIMATKAPCTQTSAVTRRSA